MLRLQLAFEGEIEQRGLEGGEVVEFLLSGGFEGAGAFGEGIEMGDDAFLFCNWRYRDLQRL